MEMSNLVEACTAFLQSEAACITEVHDRVTQTVEDTEADSLRAKLISQVERALFRRYAEHVPSTVAGSSSSSAVEDTGFACYGTSSNRVMAEGSPQNPCPTCQHWWRPWQQEHNHVNALLQRIGENSSKATAAAAAAAATNSGLHPLRESTWLGYAQKPFTFFR
ncbi:unnamed protein product [Schistocephalus solidus]|uniref:Uncharacterized protein n=1 Tax=Schistocephalus solidus TaxID=70667 RepID=A0A183TBB0_SCHSO|nr:unnamed protein product [Schistocephalus solidus]